MAFYDLQWNEIVIPQHVEEIINLSVHRWLTAEEMLVLFQNRALFPVSIVTPENTTGLCRMRNQRFIDQNVWNLVPNGNGRRVRGDRLWGPGNVYFNYTQAVNPILSRRNIRKQGWYGNNTFVHYI